MKRAASRHDRAPRIAPTSDVIGCNGKRQYDSFKDASHVAAQVRKHKDGERMGAYRCRQCQTWHIGGNGWVPASRKA